MATYEDTKTLLEQLHSYDINSLPRRDELGSELNFEEAVPSAKQVLNLYRNIPIDQIENVPESVLTTIESQAKATVDLLDSIGSFSASVGNAPAVRTDLIQKMTNRFNESFQNLYPIIAYLSTRQIDLGALETEAREKINAIETLAGDVEEELKQTTEDAKKALGEARKVAAEQGVSQQAQYFKEESDDHTTGAEDWLKYTIGTAVLLAVYAGATAFAHKIPYLAPQNTYETVQLAISKVLVFGVIAYMLILAAKTYTAHRHNAVVNKHRQNALLTYRALVEAGSEDGSRDIVLTHAASCIFSPQDTGFAKSDTENTKATANFIDAVPKVVSSVTQQGK